MHNAGLTKKRWRNEASGPKPRRLGVMPLAFLRMRIALTALARRWLLAGEP